jgi:hypothetical protein
MKLRVKREFSPVQGLPPLPGNHVFWCNRAGFPKDSTLMQPTRIALLLSLFLPAAALAQKKAPAQSEDIEHIRQELGVNEFTAPSIDLIFTELAGLKPIPFDKVWRDLPDESPQDRAGLAVAAGAVIADGFLAVSAEKQSRIEPVGRVLLRLAKGLGVGEHVTKHSRSILEKAARKEWTDVKVELTRAQADVEAALLALKDEEIAHLVALGGWIRGLEITAGIVLESYTPARARRLIQPELMDYFLERVATLNPNLKKTKLGQTLAKNLAEAKAITAKPPETPITKDEVKSIRDLAREIGEAAAGGAEG